MLQKRTSSPELKRSWRLKVLWSGEGWEKHIKFGIWNLENLSSWKKRTLARLGFHYQAASSSRLSVSWQSAPLLSGLFTTRGGFFAQPQRKPIVPQSSAVVPKWCSISWDSISNMIWKLCWVRGTRAPVQGCCFGDLSLNSCWFCPLLLFVVVSHMKACFLSSLDSSGYISQEALQQVSFYLFRIPASETWQTSRPKNPVHGFLVLPF